jgi:hypothetical protein
MSSESTDLARAVVNGADELLVQLIQPGDMPAVVHITWPEAPSIASVKRFPDTAAMIVKPFSEAHIALAAIRANRRL